MPGQQGGDKPSFWTTLPGIFTGLAALIGAIATLLVTLNQMGVIGGHDERVTGNGSAPVANGGKPGTATPPPAEPAPANNTFRVVELTLRADPFNYKGRCPVTIRFTGRISVAGGGGTVSYRFLRSDGASAPVQSITFSQPGSKTVTTTWQLGKSFQGWQAIQIYDPKELQSPRARFRIVCTNTLLPKPLVPKLPTLKFQ